MAWEEQLKRERPCVGPALNPAMKIHSVGCLGDRHRNGGSEHLRYNEIVGGKAFYERAV